MSKNPILSLATDCFESVSILLPVMDEVVSLNKTVDILLRDAAPDIKEIIIVVCERTSSESMSAIEVLRQKNPELISVHHQKLPFVGGAYIEAFDLARGSHIILMASDLETDPNDAGRMIAESKSHPNHIIATSRWLSSNSFSGYNTLKLILNWIFQKFFCALYGTQLTDMTFGYRLFPTKVVQSIQWEELRHPFFFETIIKPIRIGFPVIEIATKWIPRNEGESHNSFFRNFEYFRPGLSVRFRAPESMLKPDALV